MSDTMFPKREERVPYGGGKPVRGSRRNKSDGRQSRRERQPEPQKKRVKKGGGRKLNRNALYLVGIVILLFIVFLFVRKNGSAVFVNAEQVGILEGTDVKSASAKTQTDEYGSKEYG